MHTVSSWIPTGVIGTPRGLVLPSRVVDQASQVLRLLLVPDPYWGEGTIMRRVLPVVWWESERAMHCGLIDTVV